MGPGAAATDGLEASAATAADPRHRRRADECRVIGVACWRGSVGAQAYLLSECEWLGATMPSVLVVDDYADTRELLTVLGTGRGIR
jgi:hypothetical protein